MIVSTPTLSISNPEASRSDATVDFEFSLNCEPSVPLYFVRVTVRDGVRGYVYYMVRLTKTETSTVEASIGSASTLGLTPHLGGDLIANSDARGDVVFTD